MLVSGVRVIFGCVIRFLNVSPDLRLLSFPILEILLCQFTLAIYPTKLHQKILSKLSQNTVQLSAFSCQLIGIQVGLGGGAFVEMDTESEEAAVIEALDGTEWMGRDLKVNKPMPRRERESSGGQ